MKIIFAETKFKLHHLTLAVSFLVFTILATAPALADEHDIYVNDDGVVCSVMVDFLPFVDQFGETDKEQKKFIRKHLVIAVKSIPQGQCSPESELELYALLVTNRDSYGQPHWGSVEYLHEYRSDLRQIQQLSVDDMTDDKLSDLLKSIDE
jgi:hypothetical protein